MEGPCDLYGTSVRVSSVGEPWDTDQRSIHGRSVFLVLLWRTKLL